ncbi:unannotated protein [freshwater metagenome]|uniref:Unannotated protein n=1 Tax=freshwater metagenome TaxID=449393 RepID=A0A6J6YI11_9ZZZZ
MEVGVERRPNLVDIVLEPFDRPVHVRNRQHGPATRRASLHGLAIAHVECPVLAPLRGVRVRTQVDQVELHRLVAPEAPGVDGLEHLCVAQGRERTLPLALADLSHTFVAPVEERLQLLVGERTNTRAGLELRQVLDRVPFMADLHRVFPEPAVALLTPRVALVGQVLHEQANAVLVSPNRRVRARLVTAEQGRRPVLDVSRLPLPRRSAGELVEALDKPEASIDRVGRQHPTLLLTAPTLEHRVEDGFGLVEMDDVVGEQQMCRSRQVDSWHVKPPSRLLHLLHHCCI